jgi:four helix bundle protein
MIPSIADHPPGAKMGFVQRTRFTKGDRKHFFGIARGSIQECVPLLDLAVRRQFITDHSHHELRDCLDELGKMISGLINGLDKRNT